MHKNSNTAAHCAQAAVTGESCVVRDDFNLQPSVAWPIEFTKEDPLPTPELQLPAFDKNSLACAYQHGLHMRVGISLGVPVRSFERNQAVKRAFKVAGDIRISTFIDHNCCGSVWYIHGTPAIRDAGLLNGLLHLRGYVQKLRATRGSYFQCLNRHTAPGPNMGYDN